MPVLRYSDIAMRATALPLHRDLEKVDHVAGILKALGHPIRLRIISLLAAKDSHVTELAERLDAPQAIVSQQLRILRMSGLVDATRANGLAVYRLIEPQLHDMLACMSRCAVRVRVAPAQPLPRSEKSR